MKPLQHKKLLEYELEGFGIRLNKSPPEVIFKRKEKGGLNLTTLVIFLKYFLHHFIKKDNCCYFVFKKYLFILLLAC